MNFPDTCPNCGCTPKTAQQIAQKIDRRVYACESWVNAGAKGLSWRSHTCEYWRTIQDAAAIIREMVDDWGNAMDEALLVKAEEWLRDNAP